MFADGRRDRQFIVFVQRGARRTMLLWLSRPSFTGNSARFGSCCGRTRQGWAVPGGGQALIRSRGQQGGKGSRGGRRIVRRPARLRQPIIGPGRPGSSVVSRAGRGRPRGRRTASGSG